MAEEGLFRLVLKEPQLLSQISLSPEEFSCELLGRAYRLLRESYLRTGHAELSALAEHFQAEEMAHLSGVAQKTDTLVSDEALSDYIRIIRQEAALRTAGRDDAALLALAAEKKRYGG